MCIAKQVLECEPQQLDWLRIEDEDGSVWRYGRRGNTDPNTPAHVEGQYHGGSAIRANLVLGPDGKALLRQDEPGLPKKIVVNYISLGSPSPFPAISWWEGKVEYEQE